MMIPPDNPWVQYFKSVGLVAPVWVYTPSVFLEAPDWTEQDIKRFEDAIRKRIGGE